MFTIIAKEPLEAWLKGLELIDQHGSLVGLLTRIASIRVMSKTEMAKYNGSHIAEFNGSIFLASDAIFPEWSQHKHLTPEQFFEKFPASTYGPQTPGKWGTYYQSLTDLEGFNQLNHAITSMRGWGKRARSAFTFHMTNAKMHRPKPLGNPCLQYLALVRDDDDRLNLIMTYRAHEFSVRALGNYVGASRLLSFICHHTGYTPGGITCLSGFAFAEGKRAQRQQLITLARRHTNASQAD